MVHTQCQFSRHSYIVYFKNDEPATPEMWPKIVASEASDFIDLYVEPSNGSHYTVEEEEFEISLDSEQDNQQTQFQSEQNSVPYSSQPRRGMQPANSAHGNERRRRVARVHTAPVTGPQNDAIDQNKTPSQEIQDSITIPIISSKRSSVHDSRKDSLGGGQNAQETQLVLFKEDLPRSIQKFRGTNHDVDGRQHIPSSQIESTRIKAQETNIGSERRNRPSTIVDPRHASRTPGTIEIESRSRPYRHTRTRPAVDGVIVNDLGEEERRSKQLSLYYVPTKKKMESPTDTSSPKKEEKEKPIIQEAERIHCASMSPALPFLMWPMGPPPTRMASQHKPSSSKKSSEGGVTSRKTTNEKPELPPHTSITQSPSTSSNITEILESVEDTFSGHKLFSCLSISDWENGSTKTKPGTSQDTFSRNMKSDGYQNTSYASKSVQQDHQVDTLYDFQERSFHTKVLTRFSKITTHILRAFIPIGSTTTIVGKYQAAVEACIEVCPINVALIAVNLLNVYRI